MLQHIVFLVKPWFWFWLLFKKRQTKEQLWNWTSVLVYRESQPRSPAQCIYIWAGFPYRFLCMTRDIWI